MAYFQGRTVSFREGNTPGTQDSIHVGVGSKWLDPQNGRKPILHTVDASGIRRSPVEVGRISQFFVGILSDKQGPGAARISEPSNGMQQARRARYLILMSGPPINPHTHWWHFPANLWSLKTVLKTVASLWKVLVLHPWKSSSFVDKLPSLNVTFFLKKHVDRRIVNSGNVLGWVFIITHRKLDFCKEFRGISIQVHSSKIPKAWGYTRSGYTQAPKVWRAMGWFSQKNGHQKTHEESLLKIERFPIFLEGSQILGENYHISCWATKIHCFIWGSFGSSRVEGGNRGMGAPSLDSEVSAIHLCGLFGC